MSRALAAAALALLLAGAAGAEPGVAADPRVDLMGLLQRLSGDPSAARNPASDAAAERFAPWAAHPAVARLARMRERSFGGIVPAQYAFYLSTPLPAAESLPAPELFALRAGGRSELAAWRAELADFALASDYARWWEGRAAARAEELAAVRRGADRELGRPLARLLGARLWASWTVVVSPFHPPGGGAAWVVEENPGRPDVYVVYGPSYRGARPEPEDPLLFAESALPEAIFAVAYVLYELCRPALSASRAACDENCVHRHWVSAVSASLVGQLWGARARSEHRRRWPGGALQPEVDRAFEAYLIGRARWPDVIEARGPLSAPFLGGREPRCELLDASRYGDRLFSRRLAAYLDARLESRPDPALRRARAELEARRALSPASPERAGRPAALGRAEGRAGSSGR